jgi:hypothetical protein
MVASLFVPLIIYGFMFSGQSLPVTERVAMGISTSKAIDGLLTPLYFLIGFCMLISAATELGTTQRIEPLLSSLGVNALLVLAFINSIMILGRAVAGPISKKLSTVGMLWFSAIVSFAGL